MTPHGRLRLVSGFQNRTFHCRANIYNVFRCNTIADGLSFCENCIIIKRHFTLCEHLTSFTAAGIHCDIALIEQALIPLHAFNCSIAIDCNTTIIIENCSAKRPQPRHKVASTSCVFGRNGIGDNIRVSCLDIAKALFEFFNCGRRSIPASGFQNFRIVDHCD